MLQKLISNLENQRVKNHLRFAEYSIRDKEVSSLSPSLRKKREVMLNNLHDYWSKGLFPQNTNHRYRESYFVDKFGTPCAMGYLMLCDNQNLMVDRIKNTNNHIHLSDLKDGEVYEWIHQSGFSQKEASLVQPTYGRCGIGGCANPWFYQYIPWIVGVLTFIILEFLSFKLLGQPFEQTKGKRMAGVAYYTIVNLTVSFIAGMLTAVILTAVTFPRYSY